MKLFHGSNINIEQIDFLKSKVGKDFGCGFYLSVQREQAQEIFKEMLTEQAKQFMIEEISKEMVYLLIEEKGMSMQEALHVFYTSDTYARLTETSNGLYAQSTAYVYEYLENELTKGKIA